MGDGVSLVMPARNRIELVKRAFPEQFRQAAECGFEEVVFVDDGTDSSGDWVEGYADARYGLLGAARVRVLRTGNKDYRPNPAAAWNLGVRESSGALVLVTGAEILPGPGCYATLLDNYREWLPGSIYLATVFSGPELPEAWPPAAAHWKPRKGCGLKSTAPYADPEQPGVVHPAVTVFTGPERPAPLMFCALLSRESWGEGYPEGRRLRGSDLVFAADARARGCEFYGTSAQAWHFSHRKE